MMRLDADRLIVLSAPLLFRFSSREAAPKSDEEENDELFIMSLSCLCFVSVFRVTPHSHPVTHCM